MKLCFNDLFINVNILHLNPLFGLFCKVFFCLLLSQRKEYDVDLVGKLQGRYTEYGVLNYFASFTLTGYEDDIFEVNSNLHDQEFKFGGYIYKFDREKMNSAEFMEFVFSKSADWLVNNYIFYIEK